MNESDAWKNFITTGSVADYLKYASIKHGNENYPQEAENEVQHRRTGYSGTEYSGTGQINNCFNKK